MATGTPTPWTRHISPPTLPTTRSVFSSFLVYNSFCPLSVDAVIYSIFSTTKKIRILLQPSPVPCQVATRPCRPGTVTAPPLPASSPTTRSSSSPAWPRTRSRPPQGFLAPPAPRCLKEAPGTGTWATWAPCPGPCPRSSPGPPLRRSI